MRLSDHSPSVLALVFARLKWALLAIATLTAILTFTGCGSALRISHRSTGTNASTTSVPGVPFYVKRARCRQEVVWLEPIYTLTLTAMIPGKDGTLQSRPSGSMVLPRSSFVRDEVKDLIKTVTNGGDETTVLANWRKVTPLISSNVQTRGFSSLTAEDIILLGSSAAPVVFVDYTDQYYVNAKLPWAGSANVDAKVAEDGSLTEASGQVETKTIETLLSPVNTAITGALGSGKDLEPGKVAVFTLTVALSGYRHTLARLVDYPSSTSSKAANGVVTIGTPACPVVQAIPFGEASEYKREDLSQPPSDVTPADKKTDTQDPKKGVDDNGKNSTANKDPAAGDKSAAGDKGVKSPDKAAGKGSSGGGKNPKKKKS
jgi:hypothetical protein